MIFSRTIFFLLILPVCSQAQTWKWAKSLGNANSNTTIKTIKPNTGTNALVCGSFAGTTLSLGNQSIPNSGQDDGFVAITNPDGQYLWATKVGGTARDVAIDAATASNGDFVVVGTYKSLSLTIGATTLTNSGETDIFVVKFLQDKTLAWVKKIGTADIEEVSGVAIDANDQIYVSGQVFDKNTFTILHTFLRKLDPQGNQIWEQKGTIMGTWFKTTALAIDASQHIYLTGTLNGIATFSGNTLTCDTTNAAFIIKYSPSGAVADKYLNPDIDQINSLQIQGDKLYACAEKTRWCFGWGWPLSHSSIHTLQMDTDFNLIWHKKSGGETDCFSLDIAKSMSVDPDGNVYVAGSFFSDTLQFAGLSYPNLFHIHYYYPQIFVYKYSPAGEELWAKTMGGILSDEATSLLAYDDDKFYLGGNFESEQVTFGTHAVQNASSLDSMYVHLFPKRFVRTTMGFISMFDKTATSAYPEPVAGELKILPNPVSNYMSVQLEQPADAPLTLRIIAANGQIFRQTVYATPPFLIQEDVSGLTAGMYYVLVHTANKTYVGKMVK
ncbi:MAG: T9SS type A sorting domain-containing protein [Saprospiraceae bacterium]|nr:T9SS type A sorting domain-containing protein [Saprospiraceae bacterium]